MTVATDSAPSHEALVELLAPALGDLDAAARRAATLADDPRTDEEVELQLAPLDELISLVRERLGVPEPSIPLDEVEEVDDVLDLDPLDAVELSTDDDGVAAADAEDAEDAAEFLAHAPTRPITASHRRVPFEDVDLVRRAAELLYEDVLWLFGINDGEGALVSLERLLMLGKIEGEARDFLEINGDKLVGLYEQVLGPFTRVPTRGSTSPGEMPIGYLDYAPLRAVLEKVDGERTIAAILDGVTASRLDACAALEQLHRARIVSLG